VVTPGMSPTIAAKAPPSPSRCAARAARSFVRRPASGSEDAGRAAAWPSWHVLRHAVTERPVLRLDLDQIDQDVLWPHPWAFGSVRGMAIGALDAAGIAWTEVFVGGDIATIGAAVS